MTKRPWQLAVMGAKTKDSRRLQQHRGYIRTGPRGSGHAFFPERAKELDLI